MQTPWANLSAFVWKCPCGPSYMLSISRDPLGRQSSRQGMNCGSCFMHPGSHSMAGGFQECGCRVWAQEKAAGPGSSVRGETQRSDRHQSEKLRPAATARLRESAPRDGISEVEQRPNMRANAGGRHSPAARAASCPQAALMSAPLLCLTMTVSCARRSASWNADTRLSEGCLNGEPG